MGQFSNESLYSVGTDYDTRKCWYDNPSCPRPVQDLGFQQQIRDIVLVWLVYWHYIIEIKRNHRSPWCSACGTMGCTHSFSAPGDVSNNKYEQVNNFATSSIHLIKEILWRDPARHLWITIINVMYLIKQSVQRFSRTLRALKKETDFKPCYVATVVILLYSLDLIEREKIRGTAEITICKSSCWNVFKSQTPTSYWNYSFPVEGM